MDHFITRNNSDLLLLLLNILLLYYYCVLLFVRLGRLLATPVQSKSKSTE